MRKAVFCVWIIVSAGMMTLLAASFALTPERAAEILPPCERQVRCGRPCPLCGMSRSFMHTARGEVGTALDCNLAGPPLFLLFVMNEMALAVVLAGRLAGARKFKEERRADH